MIDTFKRIVCLVDFSEASKTAMRAASQFAALSKGKVTLVHVVHDQWSNDYQIETSFVSSPNEAKRAAIKMLQTFADENMGNVEFDFHVELLPPGNLGKAVLKFARVYGADLIVFAREDEVGSKSSRVSTFTESIVREAPCPVFLIRSVVSTEDFLRGKQLLLVDDEPDFLETVSEFFDMCILDKASDYQSALNYLERFKYDAVILDIMGVNGFDLLSKCVERGFPAIMLTAHAVTPEAVEKAVKLGAVLFLPKEKVTDIEVLLSEVLAGGGKPIWSKFFANLDYYFERRDRSDMKKIEELAKTLTSQDA